MKAFQTFQQGPPPDEEYFNFSDDEHENIPVFDYDSCSVSHVSVTVDKTAGDLLEDQEKMLREEEGEDLATPWLILPPNYRCMAHTLNLLA